MVKTKKRCCKSGPRCKRCPAVMKRLARAGHAELRGGRIWVVTAPKKELRAARKR